MMKRFSRIMDRVENAPRSRKLFIVVTLQLLLLFSVLFSYFMIDWTGEEIVLKTAPVDPFDFFRGDYVILRYEINDLDPKLLAHGLTSEELDRGMPVYVVLEPQETYHHAVGIYREKPTLTPSQKVIKGKVRWAYHDEVIIDYGIERYYLQENTGKYVEDIRDEMDVAIKVTSSGRSKVSHLLQDGKILPY